MMKRWKDELLDVLPSQILFLAKKVNVKSTVTTEFIPYFARGCRVYDVYGRDYLDFSSGVGCMNLGYGRERIRRAIIEQLSRGLWNFPHNDWWNPWATILAKRLTELMPGESDWVVFLSNSGTEANEAAMKMILDYQFRHNTGRDIFVSFHGAFHGRTLGSLALNASKEIHRKGFPSPIHVVNVDFPEEGTAVDPLVRLNLPLQRVAGVWVELVQGEGGINVADRERMSHLLRVFKKEGAVIVVDEIQTGMYRTGKMFSFEHYDFEPDVVCLGKALGGGMPIGATVAKRYLDFEEGGRHSNTFGGNAIASVAALETIEMIQEMERSGFFTSQEFRENLKMLSEVSQGGLGFMRRVVCHDKSERNRVIERALERGLILLGAGEKNIRLMPPLIISKDEMRKGIEILKESLN
jgi:4-aminobutyrate aminotransferase